MARKETDSEEGNSNVATIQNQLLKHEFSLFKIAYKNLFDIQCNKIAANQIITFILTRKHTVCLTLIKFRNTVYSVSKASL